MPDKPSGTVTFLFSDIEGSTKLARELPLQWEILRRRHHAILQAAMDAHHGYVFQIIGDAFCVAFHTAVDAIQAAAKAQLDLFAEAWGEAPIKVRIGIHTGTAYVQDNGEYNGYLAMSRVQRLLSAGCGGQTLISQPTQELVCDILPEDMHLLDLGEHRLKDLVRPEHIYQLNVGGLPADFPLIKTLDLYRHNLPVQMTSFIGREKEIAEVNQALKGHHLVTLTGPGGSGKTRLSLQVAANLIDGYIDGVWFVDLAPVSDPDLVPHAIATALNLREERATPLMDLLVSYLQRREVLIIMDNCEHLVEACAVTIDRLLHAAPHLTIIATGREALGIAGEKSFTVPSLSMADARHPSVSTLTHYDAARLFVDRALLVQPHFTLTDDNAPAVAQICLRLDGIPLAIELAAARVRAMSPEQIAARLDDSFRLLTGGSRTALPRHQTLQAMIDWSWGLLSTKERGLLMRLSVFAGGCTLEAAEAVCSGGGIDEFEIIDLLAQLVSKSLVVWQEEKGEPRYLLLETIHQYARGKLNEANGSGEASSLRQRHAEFFCQFTEQAVPKIYTRSQQTWLNRLNKEQDNLHTAIEWALESRPLDALKIVNALGDYVFLSNTFEANIRYAERALSANPDAPLEMRARVLSWTAIATDEIGDIERGNRYAIAGLDLAKQSGDVDLLAFALFIRGSISLEGGDSALAKACLEEALPLAQVTQTPFVYPGVFSYLGMIYFGTGEFTKAEAYFHEAAEIAGRLYSHFWQSQSLFCTGGLAFLRGDIEKARTDLQQSIQLANDSPVISAHSEEMLGRVHIHDMDLVGARSLLAQSLVMLQDMGSKPCLAHGLEGLARLALAQNDPQRAVRILGGITAHMKTLGMNMIPLEQALYEQTLAAARQCLDEQTFEHEWSAGEKLTVEQAIELAMS